MMLASLYSLGRHLILGILLGVVYVSLYTSGIQLLLWPTIWGHLGGEDMRPRHHLYLLHTLLACQTMRVGFVVIMDIPCAPVAVYPLGRD